MSERLAYTVREACEALRIGRTKIYELLAEGRLRAVSLGGKTLIQYAELERFLTELPALELRAHATPTHNITK